MMQNSSTNCHGWVISEVEAMEAPTQSSAPATTGRGPIRSSRLPASGDISVMKTSTMDPPLEMNVRSQPRSCSQVGMISPRAERAENTIPSARNMNMTITQPRGLAR